VAPENSATEKFGYENIKDKMSTTDDANDARDNERWCDLSKYWTDV